VLEGEPVAASLWDTLVRAMRNPAAGRPHRPTQLQVRGDERWQSLEPHIEEVGISLVAAGGLDHLEAVFAGASEHLAGKPQPGLLDVPGMKAEQVASFYEAAASFFRQAPWKQVGYEAALRVKCDKYQSGPWYAVLMGQSGLSTGLALYEEMEAIRRVWQRPAGHADNLRQSVATTVLFGEEVDLPLADVEAAGRYGWAVARPDAWPLVMHKERGLSHRPPSGLGTGTAGRVSAGRPGVRPTPAAGRSRRRGGHGARGLGGVAAGAVMGGREGRVSQTVARGRHPFCLLLITSPSSPRWKVPMSLYQRGLAALERGNCAEAIGCFTAAIRLDPGHLDAYVGRGAAYFDRQELDQAIADFTRAIRLAPVAPVYFNRGFTYDRKGEHDRALSDYGEALRLDPLFTQAYYQRGLTYAKTGLYRQAIADLTEVIRLAPKDCRAYAIRAKAYRALGDEAKAIRDENKAGELEE
jgi:hypothetical protein